jgi:hypothetical protein
MLPQMHDSVHKKQIFTFIEVVSKDRKVNFLWYVILEILEGVLLNTFYFKKPIDFAA